MTRLALAAAAWIDRTNRAPARLLEALEWAGLLDLTRWPRPRPGWRQGTIDAASCMRIGEV